MNKIIATCGITVVLSGCATTSGVVPVGKDTYMLGVEVRGGLTSQSSVRAKALQEANSYCAGLGKRMMLQHEQSSGVRGWTPQDSEIYFQCVREDDPAYSAVRMQRDPNVVIEERKQK